MIPLFFYFSASSAQVALKLFTQMTTIEQTLQNPSKKKNGKVAPTKKKSLPSLLSTQFLGALLKNLFWLVLKGKTDISASRNFA